MKMCFCRAVLEVIRADGSGMGRQITFFEGYLLRDGWTILAETFRVRRGWLTERPRERIFEKMLKEKMLLKSGWIPK